MRVGALRARNTGWNSAGARSCRMTSGWSASSNSFSAPPVLAFVVASSPSRPPTQNPAPFLCRVTARPSLALSDRAVFRARTAFTASVATLSAWNAPWLPKTRTASTPAQGVTLFREKRPMATTASAPALAALPAGASGCGPPFLPRFATTDVFFGRDRGFSGGRSLPPRRPARILTPNGPTRVSEADGIVPCRADETDPAAGTRALEVVRTALGGCIWSRK